MGVRENGIFCLIAVVFAISLAGSAMSDARLYGGLVFLMTFDEGSGNIVHDLSGNGNHGKLEGTAGWTVGRYGGGFYFDGSTHITIPNAEPLSLLTHPMSVGCWVNPDEMGGWRNIVEMDGPAGWKMGFEDSGAIVWTTYYVKDFVGQTLIQPGKWTHVVATWDGKEAIIYVNGEPDPLIMGGGGINVRSEPSLDIGYRRTTAASFYAGVMDDLFIYDKVLSQQEIKDMILAPIRVSTVYIETKQTVFKGDRFSAAINVEAITDLAGFQLDVAFNPGIIEVVGVEEGPFLSDIGGRTYWLEPDIDNAAGVITSIVCARTGQGGTDGSGELATITFTAISVGESHLKLQNVGLSDSNGRLIPAALLSGSISVTEFPPWDVNNDGRVDILDLVVVSRHFGEAIITLLDPNPDVNRDGTVSILDIVLVGQHYGEVHPLVAPPKGIWSVDPQYIPVLVKIYNIMKDSPNSDPDFLATKGLLHRLIFNAGISKTEVLQNYPNPFNPETWIPYRLAEGSEVNIKVYSVTGQLIRTLDLGYKEAGLYISKEAAAYWDGVTETGDYVSSGVYFYNIRAGNYNATKKMTVVQ